MSTGKRVNPTVWAGLMGIGIASAPSCAYAATTAAAPFNPVSALAVGAVVGLLVTIGALVAHTSTAKRRRRAGEDPEETVGATEFSMPVGDDLQAVGVDVLGLDMAPEDQAASLQQVERLALGIESDVEGPESPEDLGNREDPEDPEDPGNREDPEDPGNHEDSESHKGPESPKNHEVSSADTARAPRSVREVLSERLDGNGLGMSPVSGRANGTAKERPT